MHIDTFCEIVSVFIRHIGMFQVKSRPPARSQRAETESQPDPQSDPEPSVDVSVCAERVTADHPYSCEPDTLKRKYQETLQKLEEVRGELHNTKRREKRAKICIDKILQELTDQKKMTEEAQQLLEAYKGMNSVVC